MESPIYKNLSLEDLPSEEWSDVVGYEGLYQVSNLGRVKSLPKNMGGENNRYVSKTKIMKTAITPHGYISVNLHKNSKLYRIFVHRLVAFAFLPKVDGKEYIDHINGIRYDNRVGNLRFCTHKENDNSPLARQNKSRMSKVRFANEEYREKHKERLRKYYAKEENLEKLSKRMKKLWSDDNYRARFMKSKNNETYINNLRHTRLCKPVLQYDMNGNIINEFYSASEAYRATSINKITACCRGERNHAGGYIWKYKS